MSGTLTTTPAGWYQDPGGAVAARWWDGTRWTEHLRSLEPDPPSPTAEAMPVEQPAYVPMAYTQAAAAAESFEMYTVGSANTVGIWLLAFYPLLSLVVSGITQLIATQLCLVLNLPVPGVLFVGLPAALIFAWILAALDRRALRRAGYDPPSIYWMFLFPPLAYLIARGRAVRRDGGKAWPPELAYVLTVVGVVGVVLVLTLVFTAFLNSIGLGPNPTGSSPAGSDQLLPGMGPTVTAGALPDGTAPFADRAAGLVAQSMGFTGDPATGTVTCPGTRVDAHLAPDYNITMFCSVVDLDPTDGSYPTDVSVLVQNDGVVIYNTLDESFFTQMAP